MTSLTQFYVTSNLGGCQMKNTGIVRKIDNLGRIVLPKETRDILNLEIGSPLEIYTDGECIVLKKYQSSCVFCASNENLIMFNDKAICPGCMKAIGENYRA